MVLVVFFLVVYCCLSNVIYHDVFPFTFCLDISVCRSTVNDQVHSVPVVVVVGYAQPFFHYPAVVFRELLTRVRQEVRALGVTAVVEEGLQRLAMVAENLLPIESGEVFTHQLTLSLNFLFYLQMLVLHSSDAH